MSNTLMTDNGIIRFYDGTIIAIEAQEYSPDGINYWEETFNPNPHISTLDGVTEVGGHKFKRVKHSGDTEFQLPYRIVPDYVELRVQDYNFQYKQSDAANSEWETIFDLETLQGEDGEKGEQGIPGEGIHIDEYGYYQERPDCTSALVSSCNSCNQAGNSTSGNGYTFMSLGDGLLVLTSALIVAGTVTVDLVAYSHFSNDLVTWSALTAGIVDFEARYLATDGTGAVYTDMRTENYYGTRGNVYACADGRWTLLNNIATPSYMVGERAASTNIGFVNNFIDDTLVNFLSNTIGLTASGKLEIAEQSIDETAFASSIVGDGLEISVAMAPLRVAPADFAGFGLTTYTSDTDSLIDIQVDAISLIGDGMRTQAAIAVDGETRNLFGIDVTELVNNDSGIIAVAQVDTYYDLMINLGNGLELDGDTPQAIQVKVDNLSLEVNATDLHVKTYTAGNDGILLSHLNPNIIWANRGIALDTANGLYARIDNSTIGYDGSGQLEVPVNGITGDRLNDDTADNTKGLEVLNDMLVVKVDGSTIGFDGSGQLQYIGLTGQMVSSITPNLNGGVLDTLRDDVIFTLNNGTGTLANMTADAVTDTMVIDIDIDTAWLDAYIIANHSSSAPAWGAITGTVTNQTDLVSYISGLGHAVVNTWYNNMAISDGTGGAPFTVAGLFIKAATGETWRLIVDANGNLDTVAVV